MKFEPLRPSFASLFSVLTLLAVGILPIIGGISVGSAQENEIKAKESPLFVFRFIEVVPENVADWRQAVKDKQLKFNMAEDS